MHSMISALINESYAQSATARVEDNIFYSYKTPIAIKKNGRYYLTMDKFSATTSGQQNALLENLPGEYVSVVPHEEIISIVNGNEPSA